jgi:hypothetical protein
MKQRWVRLVSNDKEEHEIFLDRRVACISSFLEEKLNYAQEEVPSIVVEESKEVLEIIVQYLHYKNKHAKVPIDCLPRFVFNPERSMDVLKAAIHMRL